MASNEAPAGSTKPAPAPTSSTVQLKGEAEKGQHQQDAPIVPIARHPRKFLVAVDPLAKHGQSEKATGLTRDIAKEGDTVILVSVVDELYFTDTVPIGQTYTPEYANQSALDEQERVMRYQMKELEKIGKTFALGVHIVVKVIYGDVVKSLLEEADENAVDLIVIGKRKLGRLEKIISTSVSNHVSAKAHCAVLVAR